MDKSGDIKNVNVLDSDDTVMMKMIFDKIEYNYQFDDDYFKLENNMQTANVTETTSKITDVIYPMYLPVNTYLSDQNKILTEDGERIILTFAGDSSFMLVQETIKTSPEMELTPVYGDPCLIGDTIGILTDTTATWMSGGIEYYIVGDDLTSNDLVSIASSISVMPVGK